MRTLLELRETLLLLKYLKNTVVRVNKKDTLET